jgi:2-hydroxychromene-2-carboxylate isomerase
VSLSADFELARLSVLLDVRHPFAYLALRPAIAFAHSLGIEVNWLPLTAPTLNPPTAEREGDDRGTRHRRYRAQAIEREIETYAAAQGLALRGYYRDGSAEAANLGWLWLRHRDRGKLETYLTELFRAYWSLELDASNQEQVAAVLESLGADAAAFRDWCSDGGKAAAAALAGELQARGLFQVPAYLVEDEVFYGRQHLPMIRWMLDGRRGPVPI